MATIHVTDPGSGSIEALVELLEASGCVVERTGPNTIRIRAGWPLSEDSAPHELDAYLRVFQATHPGARVDRVG